ncbi:adenosylcobinamide-GDP ribazoletransferase [Novosphingobium umbonatum]|uniref:Adenosylcobinamide-GDP ribazoletransferase n=1 Tax=Novosphingobium umbonatum TaxID=1908524 RepID=A0A3S2UTC7_9SPHN|nr:adenosylcobinamide-GDP ribazoletransferase [Novosphingobium umbonatum]RVU05806.1 adenosylcobinamide-GDP ribazoletransferase [Novosphingobium umbonatum]
MKSLILALQFMTRLPLPNIKVSERDFAAAIRWFPAAGMVVGLAVWGAFRLGAMVEPWLAALLGLVVWVGVTGALHLDGLGDMADALGAAHKDSARIGDVLADPHVGSFAVVAIGVQLLAKLVLLHDLSPDHAVWLVPIAAAARIGPLVWTLALPPLHQGLGSLFRDGLRWWHAGLWGLLLLVGVYWAPWLVIAFPLMGGWAWFVKRRLGGISGDSHGAGIELGETVLLLALVCWR